MVVLKLQPFFIPGNLGFFIAFELCIYYNNNVVGNSDNWASEPIITRIKNTKILQSHVVGGWLVL